MIAKVLGASNLYKAVHQVILNKRFRLHIRLNQTLLKNCDISKEQTKSITFFYI